MAKLPNYAKHDAMLILNKCATIKLCYPLAYAFAVRKVLKLTRQYWTKSSDVVTMLESAFAGTVLRKMRDADIMQLQTLIIDRYEDECLLQRNQNKLIADAMEIINSKNNSNA